MIKNLLRKLCGYDELNLRLKELEKPTTYMAVDMGWKNPTQIVVMQKSRTGMKDRVEVINLHPKTEFVDVKNAIFDLMRQYNVLSENLRCDGDVHVQYAIREEGRKRGFKF